MQFNERAEEIVKIAVTKSLFMNNSYVTPEHVLYGIAQQVEFERAFKTVGGDIVKLIEDLDDYFMEMVPQRSKDDTSDHADVSSGFTNVIEMAAEIAKNSGNDAIGIGHILWGILQQKESFAVYYIEKQIESKEELMSCFVDELEDGRGLDEDAGGPLWKSYASLLNDEVDKKNPLIGRDEEMERAIMVLSRKDKNNPVFVGEPGVGKTAMAYGLAKRIVDGNVPDELKNANVYSLDLAALIAGTQYRGEFEKRIKAVMESFANEESPIVFLDEIHNLVGAGGLSGNTMDASNLLKTYLEDGKIRFAGATTYDEYKKHFAKNATLARRFQKIDIKEPSKEQTVEIINGLKKNYELFHHVRYSKGIPEYAVELSQRFINDRFLPDKAIDLLDEAGAYRKLHPIEGKKTQMVDKAAVEEVLSLAMNIPLQTAKTSEVDALKELYANITDKIFGQDEAVRKIVDAICMSRAGLLDENKPIASFLFVGPTGVGKTEVAKVLAKELGIELVRFDMSEYAEKHTVAKLIGSPAGYVGYEEGGLLTDAIRKTPHCVLLLDEIEKAHSDIYNVLLQVMDYASLTDNKGQKADFKNVIIIMTSNAGARMVGKQKMGFGEKVYDDSNMMEEVKKVFAPEFRNRLSSIVTFNHMNEDMAKLIVDKKLAELNARLIAKKVTMKVSVKAHTLLTNKGITKEYGAREIERVINSDIKPLLVNELLFGKLKKGGKVTVDVNDNKFAIKM